MKILVDEMPDKPSECLSAEYYLDYKMGEGRYVCKIDERYCDNVESCPFYEAISEQEAEQ